VEDMILPDLSWQRTVSPFFGTKDILQ